MRKRKQVNHVLVWKDDTATYQRKSDGKVVTIKLNKGNNAK